MQKYRFMILLALVAIIATGCAPLFTTPPATTSEAPPSNTIDATFVCPDGTSLDTTFDNTAHTVTVALPDGTVTLPQVESADGGKYSDGTTTFWNKGDEALVEVSGNIVYQNCTTQPAGDTSNAPASNTIEATFVCPDGTSLDTVFDNSAHTVTVTMPQGTVTLPPDYRYELSVETEDNVADDDYFNRGDVCISNLFATADVTPQSGNVWVSMNPNTTPTPTCSDEEIARCENWTNDDGMGNDVPAPWDPTCGCINHGSLDIGNRDSSASNITVDVPTALWASIRAENTGEMQSSAGDHCEAVVELPNVEYDATGNDFPWQVSAASNYPGEPAVSGAGYFVKLESSECGPVAHTDSPDEFVGLGNGDEQESEERGNIRICNGCITQSCDELIP